MASSGEFANLLTSDVFPASPIPLKAVSVDGPNISLLTTTDIRLTAGRYLAVYSVTAWSMRPVNGIANCKIMLFLDGTALPSSFAGGPVADGVSAASGNAVFSVTKEAGLLQIRSDSLGGILGPNTHVNVSIVEIG